MGIIISVFLDLLKMLTIFVFIPMAIIIILFVAFFIFIKILGLD